MWCSLNLSQNTPTALHGLKRTSRYADGSNFVSLDFVVAGGGYR
jgi:hypothetical protein